MDQATATATSALMHAAPASSAAAQAPKKRRRRAAAQEPPPAPATMTEANAAIYIGMSRKWLRRSRQTRNATKGAPPFIRAGSAIRYLRSDLDTWLEQHRVDAA